MATAAGEADAVPAGDDFSNPVVDGELEQETTADIPVHDDSPPSKNFGNEKPEAGKEKKDWVENFKSTLVVSGVVIAVIGVIFAVAKKIKEA